MKIVRCCCAIALFFSSLSFVCTAAEPIISRLNPPGFQRGTEADLELVGARLSDAKQLLFYDAGVEVLSVAAEGENKVKVKLKILDTCAPGLHAFRLGAATGISNLRYLGVSPLPHMSEKEPNSDFATPQEVQLNHTVNGVVQNEDVDYYSITLAENQQLNVELEGLRLGTDLFDPFVAILDENRFELARSDDAPLLQQDCVCSFTAPKAGKYVIEVRESSFGGNDNAQYRMHIGDFPRPLAIIPSGGQPGETINATLVDAAGRSWTESITLPSTAQNAYPHFASRDGKIAPSPNSLRVVAMPNALESEPDADPAKLTAYELPVAFNGVLQEAGDVDWFRFRAKKDQQIEANVYGRRVLRSPIDSVLEIHKAKGGRLALADDTGGPDSVQTFKIPEDGEYLIAIRDHLNEGSPTHAYRIEVTAPVPSLSLEIAELDRYKATLLEVPKGGRMAVMVTAQRKNFGGDLKLSLGNAPAGIELLTPTIAAAQTQIPFMLRAAADAPVGSALVSLNAVNTGSEPAVNGKLNQRTMLVRGQNNVDMWGHNSDRMSVAVCDEAPFDLQIVQPTVPLVRNGVMNLIAKVTRKGDFKDAIRLRVLYTPSGVTASGSVSIPADKSEVEIPVTANGNAAMGSFPITVLGRTKVKNGDLWLASEFINLEVVDSYFNYKFTKSSAEIGKPTVIGVELTIKRPVTGEAAIELVGLPAGVSTPQGAVKVTPDMTALSFPIEVAADAKPGQFKTLVCKATVTVPEGVIIQNQGTGELQLNAPVATAQPVAAAAPPKTPDAPAAKPLTRLEQLRQAKSQMQATGNSNPSGGN